MTIKDNYAIVGLGYTPQGECPDWKGKGLILEACANAIADAGLKPHDIDGILSMMSYATLSGCTSLQQDLGIRMTGLCANYDAMEASGGAMVQLAMMALEAGLCNYVLCAYGAKSATADKVAMMLPFGMGGGMPSHLTAYGLSENMFSIALAAKRHMIQYGTTSQQLGAVAVAFRSWAVMNPIATMRTPITIEDHQNSKMVVEPFHLLDCCLVSDGGRAFIVTSAERAKSLRQPPVYLMGFGQGHVKMDLLERENLLSTGAELSGEQAFTMAGIEHKDVDVTYLYDATTYNVISQLEELGFCKRGEGGPFVEDGRLGPDGEFPCNTSGGQLSEVDIQGFTGIHEIVRQLRGDCGERQVKGAEIGLVTNQGGALISHTTLILRR